jgi:hypothetical protein
MMRNWNRREFTRNAAMLTLFSPFIRLLAPEVAQAQQVATGPAKYLLIITSNGTAPDIWTPSGGAGSLTLPTCLNTLEPVKNDVILLNEFDSKGTAGGHGAAGAITGTEYEQTSSLDFFVADDLRSRGVLTQVPSVHLGGVSGQTGVSFRNNALQQPTFDPALAFRSIFDGTAAPPPPPPTTGGGGGEAPAPTGPSEATMRLLRRRSVLDVVTGDIGQLERAFNGIEREKLQIHIQSLRDLESRIAQNIQIQTGQVATPVPGNGGTTAPTPTFVTPVSCQQPAVQGGLQPIENSALHLEIATAAFACDITRVAHVEFGHHQSCPVNIPGASGDWHNEFMHANSDRTELTATEQFVAARVADTINRLKATQAPDGNGSLYSQTFILWAREMGDAVNHRGDNMPYMISGGAGGYLRGGNSYIRGGGTMHLSLLMAAAEAMGAVDTSNFGGRIGGRVGGLNANDRLPFAGIKA